MSLDSPKFIHDISPSLMAKLVKKSSDYTLVERGSYFWGMGNDVWSPDAGPCIIIGLGFPVGKIFHDSSWDYLMRDLVGIDAQPSKVIVTGTSIWSPHKKADVEYMLSSRELAQKVLFNKFGEENVEIIWSPDRTYTSVFYEKKSDQFYRSVELLDGM